MEKIERMNDLLKYIKIVKAAGCTLEISVQTEDLNQGHLMLRVESPSLERGSIGYISFKDIENSPKLDLIQTEIQKMIAGINNPYEIYPIIDSED